MTTLGTLRWFIAVLAGAAGFVVGSATYNRPDPNTHRTLDAVLFMQTAAEYRACCLQTYNAAAARLAEKLKARPSNGKPPAVVLDIDETVLDNSGYESYLIRTHQGFSDQTWHAWETGGLAEVGLVPGAKEFIEFAEKRGVTVVYLSNRFVSRSTYTIQALERLGLNVKDIAPRLKLFKDGDTTTSKDGRRKEITDAYAVLLWVGDNLRDFSDIFKADPVKDVAGRFAAVDENRARWGDDWFILPNPAYGEWQKLLGPDPARKLRPTALGTK